MSSDQNQSELAEQVSFGFATVSPDEKVRRVGNVFRSVADRYDLMNDVMSAGVHRIWKANTIAKLRPQPGEVLYDIAGGTGDLAKSFLSAADVVRDRRGQGNAATAVICDINDAMLRAGQSRSDLKAYADRLTWVCGDGMKLPFEDRSADVLTIAFGIRNVANIPQALSEFRRVLKPGGRFACLEFSHMTSGALQSLYDAYSFNIIPKMGEMVAGDAASYQYLVESIRKFPTQDNFKRMVEQAGFKRVSVTNYTGGVAALHFGWAI